MTTAQRVLGIPELLELILEYADDMNVFCWQRVDRAWRHVVQNSHRIQDKIHFRSAVRETIPSEEFSDREAIDDYEWNPIMFELGRHVFDDALWNTGIPIRYQDGHWSSPPLSVKALQDLSRGNAEASWKGIFVAKPPLQQAIIIWRNPNCVVVDTIQLCSEGGIKLEDLCQVHKQHLLRASQTAPKVQWIGDGYLRVEAIFWVSASVTRA